MPAALLLRGFVLRAGVVPMGLVAAACGLPPSPMGYPHLVEGVSEVVVEGSSLSAIRVALEADGFSVSAIGPYEDSLNAGPASPRGAPAMRIAASRQGDVLVLVAEYLRTERAEGVPPINQYWTRAGWIEDRNARSALLHLLDVAQELPGAIVSIR